MDLSIVILNLNTKELLKNCLDSIKDSSISDLSLGVTYEVIISDNGSSDGSQEMIKSQYPNVVLVENGKNLGFSAGNNRGLNTASGRYILFLNSDTIVERETLMEMVRFMDEHKDTGAATCYIELFNGKMDVNCHRGFPTPLNALIYFSGIYKLFPKNKFLGGYFLSYKDLNIVHEIDSLEGAFMLVRREAAEAVSLGKNIWWDEDFFFFAEDIDFCFRLKKAGWKILYNPFVKIFHYKGATHGFNKQGIVKISPKDKQKLVVSTTEGMRLFYKKHYVGSYPAIVTAAVFLAINILSKIRLAKMGI